MPVTHGNWTGTMPISLSATGLPAGVTFADNGNGSYTLSGVFPSVGTYSYSVAGTNIAGTTTSSGNQIIATANAINIGDFINPGYCSVASTPNAASFFVQFRTNGEIWMGTNSVPPTLSGQWHDGTATAADYQIKLTASGTQPSSVAAGVWHSMSATVAFLFDYSLVGEDLNALTFDIRHAITNINQGTVTFCQQLGVDVSCSPC
jgi:hypothetical protein